MCTDSLIVCAGCVGMSGSVKGMIHKLFVPPMAACLEG
jgi:hypothetical protein